MDTATIIIGLGFIGAVVFQVIRSIRKKKGPFHTIGSFVSGTLLLIGAISFFGTPLSSMLPSDFEWPVGPVDQVFRNSKGEVITVDTPTQRIQIYSEEWKFLRSITVDANGGVFKVMKEDDGNLRAFTARGNKEILYSPDGRLIEEKSYGSYSYDLLPSSGHSGLVPTPFYLIPFTSPLFGWLLAVFGGVLLAILNRQEIMKKFQPGSPYNSGQSLRD